jgi:uncharacterized protein YbjT (DUF2867 family)
VTSRHFRREHRASRTVRLTRIAGPAGDPRRARAIFLVKLRRVSTTPRIALVAGATGLIGGYLINALIEAQEYARVFALTRRPYQKEHAKLANRIVNFERMADQLKGLTANDAFCCIGTTIADAGSQEAFRETDVDAVLLFAQAARAAQATRFVVVSSVGADSKSRKFYLRTKGEMEEAVSGLGFVSVDIMQPSLLLGPRKAVRPLELAGRIFAPLLNPLLTGTREQYRAIAAETVARGMLGAARRGGRGIYRYTYGAINQLALIRSNQPNLVPPAKKKPA